MLAVQIRKARKPHEAMAAFVKMNFDVAIGEQTGDDFQEFFSITDLRLLGSRQGPELYAAFPQRQGLKKDGDVYRATKDEDGKLIYYNVIQFPRIEDGKFTPKSMEFKALVNAAALVAYKGLGIGSGVGTRKSPESKTTTEGQAAGLPGDFEDFPGALDETDLPF